MTIANSTFSREPNQQLPRESTSQYLTDSKCSCLSSDTMPPSSDTWHDLTDGPTESSLQPQKLVNNPFQSTCFVQFRSHRPTTRERHVDNNTRYFNVPNWNVGVSGLCARPCMWCVPLLCMVRNSFRCPHHSNGLRNASTRRRSSRRHTECFIQPHGRQNVEQTPCDKPQKRSTRYTFCAPLWPSHYPHKCTRQAQNGSSTWRQPRKKNCGSATHELLKQSCVLDLCCLGHNPNEQKFIPMCTKRANSKCTLHIQRNTNPTPISRTPETLLNVTELQVSIGLLDHCYVLFGMRLLSDVNTIGTFSDEYSVADLDMFVLTTTQRITSMSSYANEKPISKTGNKDSMRLTTQSLASSCVGDEEMRLKVHEGFTKHTQNPSAKRNDSAPQKK